MTDRTDTIALDFPDRLTLAATSLQMRYEERDGFLSDDDVLDAADAWCIPFDYEAEDWDTQPGYADHVMLRDSLFTLVTGDSDAS